VPVPPTRWVAQWSGRVQMAAASFWSTTRRQLLANAGCGAAGLAKTGIAPQYIRTITAGDRLLKRSNTPRTAISSNLSSTFLFLILPPSPPAEKASARNHAPKKMPHSAAGLRTKGNPNILTGSHCVCQFSAALLWRTRDRPMACRAAARKPPLNENPRRGPNHRRFSFWLKVKIKPQACLRVTRNV
jgi:hypothetical protein